METLDLLFISVFLLILSCISNSYLVRKNNSRLKELEVKIDSLEGYFKFNPDGTLCKVSDLDIDCSAVDIHKPTE